MLMIKLFTFYPAFFICLIAGAFDLGPNLIAQPDFSKLGKLPASFSLQKKDNNVILCKKRTDLKEYNCLRIPVKGLILGKLYQFGVQLKSSNIPEEYIEVCSLEFYNQKKFIETKRFFVGKGNNDWRDFSMVFTPGPNLFDRVDVVFFLQRGKAGIVNFFKPYVREIKPDLQKIKDESAKLDQIPLPDAVRPGLETMRSRYLKRVFSENSPDAATSIELCRQVEWSALQQLWKVAGEFEKVRSKVTVTSDYSDVILGFASSIEKVLPRAASFRPLPPKISLSAAQNERESFQLIVLPTGKDLKNVSVSVSNLVSADGNSLNNAFTVMPVGYVNVKPYTGLGNYIGYYPDPLMSHLKMVKTVKSGDAQSFWCRLAVPRNQTPGLYRGEATVSIDGKTAFRFPVEAQVRNFALPDRAMLPLAITFLLKEKHLKMWTDMLTDYYITPDNLYNLQSRVENPGYYGPDFDLLKKMKQDGTLNHFNLGYVDEALDNPKDNHGMKFQIDRIRPRYEKAKELGLLDYAYIYGCDESFQMSRTDLTAKIMKKEFPNVPLFTSAMDDTYGTLLPSWDWYCPLIDRYERWLSKITRARKKGKQIWWYICCSPLPPYPNIFVDSPLIEIRLLMGAMTAKYRPDGFLYYETTKFGKRRNQKALGEEVFTNWDPNSHGNVHGDGYVFYRGPDEIPLPSIRVEGFRDGLEDYAYCEILRSKVQTAKAAGKNTPWLAKAEEALQVPTSLVKSLAEHTTDPSELLAWRQNLAELIEQAE